MNPREEGTGGAATRRATPRGPATGPWTSTLFALAAGLLMIFLGYRGTLATMVDKWAHSQTYAHGYLIGPISAYLVWTRRRQLARLVPSPNPWGLLALTALSLLWLLGWASNANVIEQLAVVLMVPALVLTVAGAETVRELIFPLGYLLFAVPIGDELVPALTEFTARFAIDAIRAAGVPVLREGFFLHIPGQTWEVTKACSGVRYLIASLAVGCIFAYLQYRSLRLRLAFIGLAIVVPVFANGVRAFGIVMLGYLTNGRLATGIDHLVYGWLFFALVMMLLLWFGTRWREPGSARAPEERPAPARARGPATRRLAIVAALVVAMPAATLIVRQRLDRDLDARTLGRPLEAPRGSEGWSGPFDTVDDWWPHFESPAQEIRQVYWKGADRVELYVASYGRQRQRAELISELNRVYDPKGWRRTDQRTRDLTIDRRSLHVIETDLSRSGATGVERHRLSWHWFVVAGTPTTNPYTAKLLDLRAVLSGRRDPAVAIVIGADYADRPEEAIRVLRDFLEANGLALRRAIAPGASAAAAGDPPRRGGVRG